MIYRGNLFYHQVGHYVREAPVKEVVNGLSDGTPFFGLANYTGVRRGSLYAKSYWRNNSGIAVVFKIPADMEHLILRLQSDDFQSYRLVSPVVPGFEERAAEWLRSRSSGHPEDEISSVDIQNVRCIPHSLLQAVVQMSGPYRNFSRPGNPLNILMSVPESVRSIEIVQSYNGSNITPETIHQDLLLTASTFAEATLERG